MSDHERNPGRRRSEGPANPHPSTSVPRPPEARSVTSPLIRPEDIPAIRAAWLELHDIGLVAMRFPRRWRVAIAVAVRLMAAENECRHCNRGCHERGNPECVFLQDKLPKLTSLDKD